MRYTNADITYTNACSQIKESVSCREIFGLHSLFFKSMPGTDKLGVTKTYFCYVAYRGGISGPSILAPRLQLPNHSRETDPFKMMAINFFNPAVGYV